MKKNGLLKLLLMIVMLGWSGLAFAKANKENSPAGYDLAHPKVIALGHGLREISGISYSASANSLFAIADNTGDLYELPWNNPAQAQKWKFHDSKDFEDVVVLNDRFYILNSNGNVYDVWFKNKEKAKEDHYRFPFGKGNEFEVMYYDPGRQKLILICKDCPGDGKKQLSTYSIDPRTHQYAENPFVIDVSHVASLAGLDRMRFKPSAAAIHPVTGELYIVSSVNKLLVVADRDGHARAAYSLNPDMFKQPEGISFRSNGDMVISNESHKIGQANLLIFPYKAR